VVSAPRCLSKPVGPPPGVAGRWRTVGQR